MAKLHVTTDGVQALAQANPFVACGQIGTDLEALHDKMVEEYKTRIPEASMRYSPKGTDEIMSWTSAAKLGGIADGVDVPGKARSYAVSAWLEVPGMGYVDVTDVPLSSLDENASRAWRKELDLPVTKQLVYEIGGEVRMVRDVAIVGVWDGWCTLLVTINGGGEVKVHSMHFAEMNKASSAKLSAPPLSKGGPRVKGSLLADEYPLSFTVFDLETTSNNPKYTDICEMAAVRYIDGREEERISLLVYIDGDMPRAAERVHHISRDMLEDEPHMAHRMKEFLDFIGDDGVLVGHNILDFDIPILARVAEACGMSFSYSRAIDTLVLARKTWPSLSSHKMDKLRIMLHLDGADSHRALKDCYDEAKLYMVLRDEIVGGAKTDLSAFPNQEGAVATKRRRASRGAMAHRTRWGKATKKAKDFVPATADFDMGHPLYMKLVVITGDLPYGTRDDVMQRICDLGGKPQDNVTMKTNYVVVGDNAGRSKIAKAKQYRETKGLPIDIVTAEEFESLLEA